MDRERTADNLPPEIRDTADLIEDGILDEADALEDKAAKAEEQAANKDRPSGSSSRTR